VQSGVTSTGATVPLQPVPLEAPLDINYSHVNWYKHYAGGTL